MVDGEPDPLTGPAGVLPVDPEVTAVDRAVPSRGPAAPARAPRPAGRTGAGDRRRPRGRARVRYLSRRTRRVLVNRADVLAVIAAGGALGSLARWGLAQALPHPGAAFPWATFDANVSGCFLLGVLMVLVTEVWPPSRYVRPFLGVGVLGGFTTFSTYVLDTRMLLLSGRTGLAGAYVSASLLCGLAAVWVGIVGVRTLVVLARRRLDRSHGRSHERGSPPTPPAPGSVATAYTSPPGTGPVGNGSAGNGSVGNGSAGNGSNGGGSGSGSPASTSTTTRRPR